MRQRNGQKKARKRQRKSMEKTRDLVEQAMFKMYTMERTGLEPTTYRSLDFHPIHYTTKACGKEKHRRFIYTLRCQGQMGAA